MATAISWQSSLEEGRRQAAAEKRPLFIDWSAAPT